MPREKSSTVYQEKKQITNNSENKTKTPIQLRATSKDEH